MKINGDNMDQLTHYSVMKEQTIELLAIKPNGIYVDCTLGGGGHSEEILKRLTNGHLYCFDLDMYAINKASERLKKYLDKVTFIHANYAEIKEKLAEQNISQVDGILYDLGVSSFQLDDDSRGFSYRFDAKLDMRMNQEQALSAYDVVNDYSEQALTKILFEYGEEKFARKIAAEIVKNRKIKPIETTFELVEIIKKSLPAKVLRQTGHPAKQTFQAIRIEVNQELESLKKSITDAFDLLNKDGRIVVITFHSLEDRIVKNLFKEKTTLDLPQGLPFIPEGMSIDYELVNKKIILADDSELNENHRSHSAKLRAIKKIK